MNFITNLFFSKFKKIIYNFILIIVNRFTKYVCYIFIKKNWNSKKLKNIFIDKIFIKFNLFKSIINDRKFLFIVNYWLKLCYNLQIKLKYNTTFHFQTNEQTERQNQILKQYLRCYVNYQQNNWTKWLNLTKYAYNNIWHNIIQISSFQTLFDEISLWKKKY